MNRSLYSLNKCENDEDNSSWDDSKFKIPSSNYISRLFDRPQAPKKNEFRNFLKQTNDLEQDEDSDSGQEIENVEENELKEKSCSEEEIGEGEDYETFLEYNEEECKSDDICFGVRTPNTLQSNYISLPNPTTPQLIPTPIIAPINVPIPETQKISEQDRSEKSDCGNSQSAKRKDVCIKSILRSMRRYYCTIMESSTLYKRKEKKIKFKHLNLISCAQNTVSQLKLGDFSSNMGFYFLLFSYSCDMRKILEKLKLNKHYLKSSCNCEEKDKCTCVKYEVDVTSINKGIQIINLVENTLNKFSNKIFNKLISMPEIAYLVQNFISQNNEQLQSSKDFEDCIQILDQKSKEVINNHSNSSSNQQDTKSLGSYKESGLRMKCKEEYYISNPFFKNHE